MKVPGKLLYRIDEVVAKLSISRRTVYRLIESGDLTGHNANPGKKGLRITAASLDRYVTRHEQREK